MKIIAPFVFLLAAVSQIQAQQANLHLTVQQKNNSERSQMLRSYLALRESDEGIFWPLYAQYEQRASRNGDCSFPAINQLRASGHNGNFKECVSAIFKNLYEEITLKMEYFDKINAAMNGLVAFQFLQSETLLDLIHTSKAYEKLNWDQPQWNKNMLKDEKTKLSVMEFVLGITASERAKFLPIYEDYEFEYSRVVGHQFVWFEQYVEEVEAMTPAQGKRMGREFLAMQQKEIRLRETFFLKVSESLGENFAARFLALEDYFSNMAKLKTWSDAITSAR